MSLAVSPKELGAVVSLLSYTLDKDITKASTVLKALDQRVQETIHGKLWEVMGRPDYYNYGGIAFTDPSKLPENLRPTPEQKFVAVNNYLMTFPSYIASLQRSLTQISCSPAIASPHATLPDDLMLKTFSFLSPEDLARASTVCKEWRTLSADAWRDFDLKKICQVIDEEVWERHVDLTALGLDASGAPAIDKRIAIPILKKLSSQVERNAGVTLLTMPKGLTLNKLITLAAAPKQGPATRFEYIMPRIVEVLGNVAVDKTYTIAITNFVVNESRAKCIDAQRKLVQENRGDLPEFLTVATLIFLTFVSSPEGQTPTRPYGKQPPEFTRCPEKIDGCNLVIGGYNPTGLRAGYFLSNFYDIAIAIGACSSKTL